jgi:hypothetical protein
MGPGGSMAYVLVLTLVAALGGLLFGYDTAVISGAIGFLQSHFELDPQLWKGWAAASALVGCAVGAAVAGMASDRLGRKKVLLVSAVLFLVSALGTALPRTFTEFIVYRILGGLGVGAASMTSPMYIAEISPARVRGRMVSINQFAIIFGMLVVYFVNYFIGGHGASLDRQAIAPRVAEHGRAIDPERAAAFLQTAAKRSTMVDLKDKKSVDAFQQDVREFLDVQSDRLEAQAVVDFLKRYEVNVEETHVLLANYGLVSWNVSRGWRWMFGFCCCCSSRKAHAGSPSKGAATGPCRSSPAWAVPKKHKPSWRPLKRPSPRKAAPSASFSSPGCGSCS